MRLEARRVGESDLRSSIDAKERTNQVLSQLTKHVGCACGIRSGSAAVSFPGSGFCNGATCRAWKDTLATLILYTRYFISVDILVNEWECFVAANFIRRSAVEDVEDCGG